MSSQSRIQSYLQPSSYHYRIDQDWSPGSQNECLASSGLPGPIRTTVGCWVGGLGRDMKRSGSAWYSWVEWGVRGEGGGDKRGNRWKKGGSLSPLSPSPPFTRYVFLCVWAMEGAKGEGGTIPLSLSLNSIINTITCGYSFDSLSYPLCHRRSFEDSRPTGLGISDTVTEMGYI